MMTLENLSDGQNPEKRKIGKIEKLLYLRQRSFNYCHFFHIFVLIFLLISLHFSEFICISQHFSTFPWISLHFTSFLFISLHFSTFLLISLHFSEFFKHFSAFLCISLHISRQHYTLMFYYYSLLSLLFTIIYHYSVLSLLSLLFTIIYHYSQLSL